MSSFSMNIAALATVMQQKSVQAEAGGRIARMIMDSAEGQGEQLTAMIEETTQVLQQALEPHRGQNINTLI